MADNSSAPRPKGTTATPAAGGSGLTKKVGPFPIWVYMVVLVAALYVYEKKKAGGAKTPAGTTGTGTTPPQGPDAVTQSALEQSLAANVSAPTTNPQWEANAEAILVGYGYPMVQVQAALNTYLAGGVLSSIQQEIVNASIEAVGAPPSPPSNSNSSTASPTVATPPTAAPTAPSTQTSVPPPATSGAALPPVNAASYPTQYKFGQYSPSEFTPIGTVNNGKATGFGVSGGVPVYAGLYGGLEQNFDLATLPNGTQLYIPSIFASYIDNSP